MTLVEALEKGRGWGIKRKDWPKHFRIFLNIIHLSSSSSWQENKNSFIDPLGISYAFSPEDIFAGDWEPYLPETEKCDACRRADKIEGYENTADWIVLVNKVYAEHLRKDHCTCGGKR